MKIAVTYENGEVFQHFGHTEQFKLYEVSGGKLLHAQVVDTNGSGHGALAGLLAQLGVDTLICGGIGVGAVAALKNAGIQILGGASGDADERVADFLGGALHFDTAGSCATCTSSCGHHHEDGEEEECDGNVSACGSSCF